MTVTVIFATKDSISLCCTADWTMRYSTILALHVFDDPLLSGGEVCVGSVVGINEGDLEMVG